MMKLALSKLLVLILFFCSSAQAQWTGITLGFGDETIPVQNAKQNLLLTPYNIRLAIEGKTQSGLRIGVAAAQSKAEIKNDSIQQQQSLQGFQLFFRAPYSINDHVELEASTSIAQFYTPDSQTNNESLDWLSKQVSIALYTSIFPIRIGIKAHLRTISGELQSVNQHIFFNESQSIYTSYSLDYQTEKTAYIRFQFTEHSNNTFIISFAKVY